MRRSGVLLLAIWEIARTSEKLLQTLAFGISYVKCICCRMGGGGSLCPSFCPDVAVRCFTTVRTSYYRYLSCIRVIYHV